MSLYVVMIELKGQRWFLRKTGTKFTPTSSVTSAYNFRTIPSADKQRNFWNRKYPITDTYRLVYRDGEPKLYTLEGEPVGD